MKTNKFLISMVVLLSMANIATVSYFLYSQDEDYKYTYLYKEYSKTMKQIEKMKISAETETNKATKKFEYEDIAYKLFTIKEFEKSIEMYKTSLLFDDDPTTIRITYDMISSNYFYLRDYAEAIRYLHKAMEIDLGIDDENGVDMLRRYCKILQDSDKVIELDIQMICDKY